MNTKANSLTTRVFHALALPLLALTVSGVAAAAGDPAAQHWTLLNTYCEKCHNAVDWAGGVAFDTLQPGSIAKEAKTWEATVRKLRGQMMPPPGEERPDAAAVNDFVSWLESRLDEAGAASPQAGYVSLHRLNRAEYARSVKELLNVDVDPASLLPQDTLSDGFDNIANVLKVSPTFLDQYVSAARTVAALAVGNAQAPRAIATYRGGRHSQAMHIDGMPLGTRGGFSVTHNFPADGTYTFNLNVGGGGGYGGGGQEHRAIFLIDGKQVFERTFGGPEDLKKSDQLQQEATKEFQARFRGIELPVTAGPHQLTVTFQQRAMSESDDWLSSFNPAGGGASAPSAGGIEINGPVNVTGMADTPSRQRIFICRPTGPDDELPCAKKILTALTTAAYRRPVTDEDLEAPLRFFEVGRKGKDFDAGIQNSIVAILATPKFLYRAEQAAPQVADASQSWRIADLDLASRLSFFLWSQGPDQQLLDLAAANRLHEPEQIKAQVVRMLADPRANTLVTNFAFQWLQVGSMDKIIVDETIFPNFDEDLRSAFRKEMELWLGSVLLQDRPVTDLLTSDWSYLNERLALHYGIRDVRGPQFRRVALNDSHRFGLLGKGAMLLGTSYANRTAPVLRGAYVLEVISGTPPAAPPPAIPALKENVPGGKAETVRERMEAHRSVASCNACHGIMDPLGLALENFDALGAWQSKDADTGTPIDSDGSMVDGRPVRGPDGLRNILAGNANQFVQALTVNLMTYALGRSVEYFDMPQVRRIVREAEPHGNRFEDLVLGIVNSPEFQTQQLPSGEEKVQL
ncbi:MAG: DUF1592 domain-containing protein [Nevskiaceae bacterium]|jgi:hypothetical protein|nr:DUF1592 domain-containing protein [Nevskiaceae bacterium]